MKTSILTIRSTLLSTLLLIGTSAVQADANADWDTDGRSGDRYEHTVDHKKHRQAHNNRHEEKSNKKNETSNKQHKRSHKKKDRHAHNKHAWHNSNNHRHDKHHSSSHAGSKGSYLKSHHRHNRHDRYDQYHHRGDSHNYRPRQWQAVTGFRGRSGRDVTRYINVDDRVRALSIQGTKRAMYIREAHALLGNGRWIRVEGLEGYVGRGERIKHRLRNPRFVQKVVLEVEPARHKRGYAQLLVKPA